MKNYLKFDKIAILLSKPITTNVIILISIFSRIVQVVFFYNIRIDNSYMYLATQNMLDGNGFATAYVLSNNLSVEYYKPMVMWPPGFSFILSPFYLLFDRNYIAAGITIDIIFATLLIIYTRRILKLFQVPLHLINVFTLLTSFFTYHFYFIASTDSTTISINIIAIYYGLHTLILKKLIIRNSIIISFCLLLCGLLKYLFIPVIFIIPCFFIYYGITLKHKKILNSGLLIINVLLAGMVTLYLYQKAIAGKAGHITAKGRGLFPEHLQEYYPYFTASFMREETLAIAARIPNNITTFLFKIIHVIILILNIVMAGYLLFIRKIKNLHNTEIYLLLFTAFSLSITLLLAALSLTVEKEKILDHWLWTYIQEPRYYGLVTVLLHIALFIFYYQLMSKTSYRLIFFVGLSLLFIEFCRGSIFLYNRVQFFGKEEYSWKKELRFQQYADHVLQAHIKEKFPKKIVLASTDEYYRNRISLYNNLPVIKDLQSLNSPETIKSNELTLIFIAIKDEHRYQYFKFFNKVQQKEVGRFEDYAFYTLLIKPAS